jgi:glutaredoxin-like YruB-family protein
MKVEVYSTPTCMYCNLLKDFLKEKNVEFTEINVADDEEKRTYIVEKSGQMGVPVTLIGEEVVIGFNKDKISELLGLEG